MCGAGQRQTTGGIGWAAKGCTGRAGLGWVAVSGAQQVERIDPRASVGARLRQVLSSWIAVEGVCGRRARFEARRRTRPRRAPRVFERDRAAPWRARRACRRGRRRGRRAPTTPSCGWRGAGEAERARCAVGGVWSGVRALRHYVCATRRRSSVRRDAAPSENAQCVKFIERAGWGGGGAVGRAPVRTLCRRTRRDVRGGGRPRQPDGASMDARWTARPVRASRRLVALATVAWPMQASSPHCARPRCQSGADHSGPPQTLPRAPLSHHRPGEIAPRRAAARRAQAASGRQGPREAPNEAAAARGGAAPSPAAHALSAPPPAAVAAALRTAARDQSARSRPQLLRVVLARRLLTPPPPLSLRSSSRPSRARR